MWTRLRACVSRLAFLWARRRLDDEARQEIDAHLDLLIERYRHQGLSPDQAYLAARRRFGNPALVCQDIHDLNGLGWVDRAAQDFRDASRQLRTSPGFVAVAAATLALGIGGATAVFSVVHAVLLAPLSYEEPGQLVRFHQQEPDNPDTRDVLAATHFAFLRDHARSFEHVAALAHYSETGLDLAIGGGVERLRVLRVSSGYFGTFRAALRLGRDFTRDDETGRRRVILSDAVWRAHFSADPSIVGTAIRLSAEPYEVAAIAPPDFEDPIAPDVAAWIPYNLSGDTDPENTSLTGVGRLRQGVSIERSRAELATLSHSMRGRWPAMRKSAIVATPLHEELVAAARGPLRIVFAAVWLVLIVACVNVANLMLVRATGRVHEFAVRAALGSSRSRLVRQLMAESVLVACLGGAIGFFLADAGIRVLQMLGRDALPRVDDVALDSRVLIFGVLVTAATALASGLAPVFRLAGISGVEALRRQSRSSTGTRGLARIRATLAAAQVALAVTLVAGAGVLVVSFRHLQRVDLGVDAARILTFEVHLPRVRYDAARRAAFHEQLARRVAAIPGVSAAGGISRLPATGSYHPWNSQIRTGPLAGTSVDKSRFALQQRVVSGNAFAALGIALLAGRIFDARDTADVPARAVVTANFARVAFPGVPHDQVPGQRIAVGGRDLDIVGVVGDVALDVYGAPSMVVYHAHRQSAGDRNWGLTQVAATMRSPATLLSAVRDEVARLDPELVVYKPTPMSEVMGRGTSRERFALVLVGAFALVSLALASLGLYGMLAYAVRQRTTEIGIRMALGASGVEVRSLVFRQAAFVVIAGVAAGLAGALAMGRWLAALAFGITPSDPRILMASTLVLFVVALAAAWLPARRASRVDPTIAMQAGH